MITSLLLNPRNHGEPGIFCHGLLPSLNGLGLGAGDSPFTLSCLLLLSQHCTGITTRRWEWDLLVELIITCSFSCFKEKFYRPQIPP